MKAGVDARYPQNCWALFKPVSYHKVFMPIAIDPAAMIPGAAPASATRHPFQTDDRRLNPVAEKVLNGERLSFEDGLTLYRSADILAVG